MASTDDVTMGLLERLFEEGRSYEIVGTTVGDQGRGSPNAATLGVKREGNILTMRVFKGSDTFDNLRGLRRIGINVVGKEDVDLLARAALVGWGSDEEEEFAEKDYENLRGFPFLKKASIQLDCKVEDWTEKHGRDDYGEYHIAIFKAVPEKVKVNDENTLPLERRGSPIIEAMVLVTRWAVSDGEIRDFLGQRVMDNLHKARLEGKSGVSRAIKVIEHFMQD